VNGANEQAVELFLQGKILYKDIYKALYGAVQSYFGSHHTDIEELEGADAYARQYVKELFGV
jgi:1-deoxy-D-xylulose 5-phosphate reductoisomerase